MKTIINKEGTFWFKNDEKNRFKGVIVKENNDFLLKTKIQGKFNGKIEHENIIIGKIENTLITIYNCYLINQYPELIFLVEYIFKNYNYESELSFKNILIKFHNLEEWIKNQSFEIDSKNNNTIIKPKLVKKSFKLEEFNINFLLGYTESWNLTSYSITSNYSIQIEYHSPQKFKNILDDIRLIEKFLSFAMYTPTNIKSIKCNISDDKKRPEYVYIYSKSFNKKTDTMSNYDILINFYEIQDKTNLFEKWFEACDNYKPLFDIYFTNFSTNYTLEYQFLSHTQALEAYMRKNEIFKDYYMDSEEYETIKSELNEYVKNSKMDEDHKQSWESRIKYGNEVSLRKRLKDLITFLKDYDIVKEIVGEKSNKFIDKIIDNRNHYTHYDENSDFKENIFNLINLNFKLKLLIELCILNELDFDKEFIENKLIHKYQRRPIPL